MTLEEEEAFRKKIREEQVATLERVLAEWPLSEAYNAIWNEMQHRLSGVNGMLRMVLGEVRHNLTEEQKQDFLAAALENCNLAGELLGTAGRLFAPRLRDKQ